MPIYDYQTRQKLKDQGLNPDEYDLVDEAEGQSANVSTTPSVIKPKSNPYAAGARSFGTGVLPTTAGLVAGSLAAAPFTGGASLVAGLGTGLVASLGTHWLQKKAIEEVSPELSQQLETDVQEHPVATTVGGIASALPTLGSSVKALPGAGRALSGLITPYRTVPAADLNALKNVALNAAIQPTLRLATDKDIRTKALQGDPEALGILGLETVGGGLLSDPRQWTKKIGLHPNVYREPEFKGAREAQRKGAVDVESEVVEEPDTTIRPKSPLSTEPVVSGYEEKAAAKETESQALRLMKQQEKRVEKEQKLAAKLDEEEAKAKAEAEATAEQYHKEDEAVADYHDLNYEKEFKNLSEDEKAALRDEYKNQQEHQIRLAEEKAQADAEKFGKSYKEGKVPKEKKLTTEPEVPLEEQAKVPLSAEEVEAAAKQAQTEKDLKVADEIAKQQQVKEDVPLESKMLESKEEDVNKLKYPRREDTDLNEGGLYSEEEGTLPESKLSEISAKRQDPLIKGAEKEGLTLKPTNRLFKMFQRLGITRNIDVQKKVPVKNIYDKEGKVVGTVEAKGEMLPREGLETAIALIHPTKATIDTTPHEIFEGFREDLINHGTDAEKKMVTKGDRTVEKSTEYQEWAKARKKEGKNGSVREWYATHTGEDAIRRVLRTDGDGKFKAFLKDFWSAVKVKYGNAESKDFVRLLSNKLINDAPFHETFGKGYTPKVTAPPEEKTTIEEARTPKVYSEEEGKYSEEENAGFEPPMGKEEFIEERNKLGDNLKRMDEDFKASVFMEKKMKKIFGEDSPEYLRARSNRLALAKRYNALVLESQNRPKQDFPAIHPEAKNAESEESPLDKYGKSTDREIGKKDFEQDRAELFVKLEEAHQEMENAYLYHGIDSPEYNKAFKKARQLADKVSNLYPDDNASPERKYKPYKNAESEQSPLDKELPSKEVRTKVGIKVIKPEKVEAFEAFEKKKDEIYQKLGYAGINEFDKNNWARMTGNKDIEPDLKSYVYKIESVGKSPTGQNYKGKWIEASKSGLSEAQLKQLRDLETEAKTVEFPYEVHPTESSLTIERDKPKLSEDESSPLDKELADLKKELDSAKKDYRSTQKAYHKTRDSLGSGHASTEEHKAKFKGAIARMIEAQKNLSAKTPKLSESEESPLDKVRKEHEEWKKMISDRDFRIHNLTRMQRRVEDTMGKKLEEIKYNERLEKLANEYLIKEGETPNEDSLNEVMDEMSYAIHNVTKPYDVENAELNEGLGGTPVSEAAQTIFGRYKNKLGSDELNKLAAEYKAINHESKEGKQWTKLNDKIIEELRSGRKYSEEEGNLPKISDKEYAATYDAWEREAEGIGKFMMPILKGLHTKYQSKVPFNNDPMYHGKRIIEAIAKKDPIGDKMIGMMVERGYIPAAGSEDFRRKISALASNLREANLGKRFSEEEGKLPKFEDKEAVDYVPYEKWIKGLNPKEGSTDSGLTQYQEAWKQKYSGEAIDKQLEEDWTEFQEDPDNQKLLSDFVGTGTFDINDLRDLLRESDGSINVTKTAKEVKKAFLEQYPEHTNSKKHISYEDGMKEVTREDLMDIDFSKTHDLEDFGERGINDPDVIWKNWPKYRSEVYNQNPELAFAIDAVLGTTKNYHGPSTTGGKYSNYYSEEEGSKLPRFSEDETTQKLKMVAEKHDIDPSTLPVSRTPWEMHLFGLRPEIDKIPDKSIKDSFSDFFEKITENRGKYVNGILRKIRNQTNLSSLIDNIRNVPDYLKQDTKELQNVRQWFDNVQDKKPNIDLTENEVKIRDAINEAMQLVDTDKTARGIGPKNRLKKNFLPQTPSNEVIGELQERPDSAKSAQYKQEFLDYQTKVEGKTPERAAEDLKAYLRSFTKEKVNIAKQFSQIDKAEVLNIPPEWREKNLLNRLNRYMERVSRRFAYHDAIGSKEGLLENIKKYQGNEAVSNVYDDITGINPKEEQFLNALGGNVRAGRMGILTGIKDFTTNFTLGMQHQQNPIQTIRSAIDAFSNMSQNISDSFKTGRNRTNMNSLEWNESPDLISTLRRTRDILSDVQGRNYLEQMTRATAFGMGRFTTLDFHSQFHNGKLGKQGKKWFDDFGKDIDWKKAELTPEDINKISARYVDSVQGTYDPRGLPSIAMKGQLSPVLSLARWNIEKANNFMKHVVNPLKNGNPYPALMATVGGLIGGAAVTKLVEAITGRKEKTPKLEEIKAISEEEGKDTKMASLYKLTGLAAASGYAGMLGDISKGVMDTMYGRNKPQWYNNILLDAAADTADLAFSLAKSSNDNGFSPELVGDAIGKFIEDNIQTSRMIMAQVSAERKDEIERANKFRDLRVYNTLAGNPIRDLSTDWGQRQFGPDDMKKFKRTGDVGEAVELLPKLLDKAFEKADGDPERLIAELGKIKKNSYQTMPNPDTIPLRFIRYLTYLEKSQGEEVAQNRLADYLMQNAVNEAKSSAVP